MSRTIQVAKREFVATVATKGFIIGVLVFPAIMVGIVALIPLLISDEAPKVVGEVVVVDRSGWEGSEDAPAVPDLLASSYRPEVLAAERELMEDQATEALERRLGNEQLARRAAERALEQQILADLPEIDVREITQDESIEALKPRLYEGDPKEGGLLAVVLVEEGAIVRSESAQEFGGYRVFLRPRLDDRVEDELHRKVQQAITRARVAAADRDLGELMALLNVSRGPTTVVTPEGEREGSAAEAQFLIAGAFMMLLWIGAFTGGNYLMMTVIEEKASRVMEVLLSAVSPTQLMTGKILGQMAVAFSILSIYVGLGVWALVRFDLLYLIQPSQVGVLVAFFIIAFLLIGSLMAAIGSAVTEIKEAQALLTPVMMLFMIPLFLWYPLARNPNSLFATVVTFVPPINPFVTVIRMSGSEEVPIWQIGLSLAIGVVSVLAAIWATAKIFRIGVLMYGKPPNLPTLIKWIRMA